MFFKLLLFEVEPLTQWEIIDSELSVEVLGVCYRLLGGCGLGD